jgi:hypothetical protein
MYDIVKQLFPVAAEAFEDYDARRRGLLLSGPDAQVIQELVYGVIEAWAKGKDTGLCLAKDFDKAIEAVGWPAAGRCRERDECLTKLVRLGLMPAQGVGNA